MRIFSFLTVFLLFFVCGCTEIESSLPEIQQKAQAGNPEAQYRLGRFYLFGHPELGRDSAQGFQWLTKSAGRDHSRAAYLLGTMYLNGEGVPTNQVEALKYFQKAAEHGLAAAQNKVGEIYLHGWGVTRDFDQAATYFRQSAKQGLAVAQYNLAQRYYKGEGVRQSDSEAAKCLEKAANQGHPVAQVMLAQRYADGSAGKIDYVEAYKWTKIVGDTKLLQSLEEKIKPDQRKKAEAEASRFRPVLELDPDEAPRSTLKYWLLGILIVGLYTAAGYVWFRRRRRAA